MSGKSDYLEGKVLDHVLGVTAFTMPSSHFMALYSSDPGDDNSGTELTAEPGYARQAISFAAAASSSSASSDAQTFTSSGVDWSTATHFGVFDALTGGNLLYHGELGSGLVIGSGGHTFAAGDLTITEG